MWLNFTEITIIIGGLYVVYSRLNTHINRLEDSLRNIEKYIEEIEQNTVDAKKHIWNCHNEIVDKSNSLIAEMRQTLEVDESDSESTQVSTQVSTQETTQETTQLTTQDTTQDSTQSDDDESSSDSDFSDIDKLTPEEEIDIINEYKQFIDKDIQELVDFAKEDEMEIRILFRDDVLAVDPKTLKYDPHVVGVSVSSKDLIQEIIDVGGVKI